MGDLSKHFSKAEFKCECCGLFIECRELINRLEKVRKKVGVPIRVNSGTRCIKHNTEVGGADNSKHMAGLAADIECDEMYDLLDACTSIFKRVGVYSGFLHVDVADGKGYWVK